MITWSDPNQLEAYVLQLHAAAERLTQENRKLRQVHLSIGEQVCQLMDVSLLKQQGRWKEKIEALRTTVDNLQPHYSGMKGLRMHWDMQLFKALEHQYQVGLEGLHMDLPQIKCELEFKNRQVQLRPAIEELRTEFYREIKKFIGVRCAPPAHAGLRLRSPRPRAFRGWPRAPPSATAAMDSRGARSARPRRRRPPASPACALAQIPTGFKGLGYYEEGQAAKHKVLKIFRDMPDRNVSSLHVVYENASELFAKLEALIARYRPYVTIGMYQGNIDDLIEEKFTDGAQFDASFKALKAKRKEAEKLPSFERVDCITVSLAPFKAALEDQQQRLSDTLLVGMRRVAAARTKEIEQFITESLERLSHRPQSMDEIGDAKRSWQAIMHAKEPIKAGFKKLDELNKMMKSVSKQGVDLGAL